MRTDQFLMSAIFNQTHSVKGYNANCNRMTDLMSYLNESFNNLSSIYARLMNSANATTKGSIMDVVNKSEALNSSDGVRKENYEILSAMWRSLNSGAITTDNIRIKGDGCNIFPDKPYSANIPSRIPGQTITVYEQTGRVASSVWIERPEIEEDSYFVEMCRDIIAENDPVHRSFFGFVPYLLPHYFSADMCPVAEAYKATESAYSELITSYLATKDGSETGVDNLSLYFEAIIEFFNVMLDVYTNDQFSSGIYKAV